MPAESIVGRILRLPGYGAYRTEFDEATSTTTLWVRQVSRRASYTCRGCGIGVVQGADDAADERGRDQGPRPIVDEDAAGRGAANALQAPTD